MSARQFHFSVDDVSECVNFLCQTTPLQTPPQLPEKNIGPAALLSLVARYAITADLYFYLDDIAECSPSNFNRKITQQYFRFAPHATNHETPPHILDPQEREHFIRQGFSRVDELFGENARSSRLRLHYFSEPLENHECLHKEGVTHILLTDKPALTYRMNEDARAALQATGEYRLDHITYASSHIRLETMLELYPSGQAVTRYLDSLIETRNTIYLFTHEINLYDHAVIKLADFCIGYLVGKKLESV